MIVEYHRPATLQAALELLARSSPLTLPLAGGTVLNRFSLEPFAVADLQALGLNGLERQGATARPSLMVGAMVTLQQILDFPDLPEALCRAVRHEAAYNQRQVATLAGTLTTADGRSPLAAVLLALDALLTLQSQDGGQEQISLGDWLPRRSVTPMGFTYSGRGQLITAIRIPLDACPAYEYVARTPADRPIVCAAAARWPKGRLRLTLGGFGNAPVLVMDGPETRDGSHLLAEAARSAYAEAGDAWASAEYRREIAAVLSRRCLEALW